MRALAFALIAVAWLVAGCAGRVLPLPTASDVRHDPAFSFDADTFAFPNLIRARHRGEPDLYANYCFVLARALRQFHVGARFDPSAPKLTPAEYADRVRAIADRPAWYPPLPTAERIVIPGYANLREFSRAEEATVKGALGGRVWTWIHWTNWRVTLPVTAGHQAEVAREIVDELGRGRLVQLLVTNWPKPELNHTVVAFAARNTTEGVEFSVWDPNDPGAPGVMTFDHGARRFQATRLYDTETGPIRAFRMYYSWFL